MTGFAGFGAVPWPPGSTLRCGSADPSSSPAGRNGPGDAFPQVSVGAAVLGAPSGRLDAWAVAALSTWSQHLQEVARLSPPPQPHTALVSGVVLGVCDMTPRVGLGA